jgi:hypothetical protein
MREGGRGATLVEAFPAAQLRHWGLPNVGYGRADGAAVAVREEIMSTLAQQKGLVIGPEHHELCLGSADALDAVICCYAAASVAFDRIGVLPGGEFRSEGHTS